jgi:hypothetical protein
MGRRDLGRFDRNLGLRHSSRSAGIQIDMDISAGILVSLDAGYPCRHDGNLYFHAQYERKLMKLFVVLSLF